MCSESRQYLTWPGTWDAGEKAQTPSLAHGMEKSQRIVDWRPVPGQLASDLCPCVYSRSGQSPAGWPLLAGTMAEAGDGALSVAEWLRALHLEQYTRLFEQHGLVWATDCQGLSDTRLVDMGMVLPGHRRRILAGLLRAHTPPAPAPRLAPRPWP